MKQYLVCRVDSDPDNVSRPNAICMGCDTVEEAEEYILNRDPSYNYLIFRGVACYSTYRELRKTPIFQNRS